MSDLIGDANIISELMEIDNRVKAVVEERDRLRARLAEVEAENGRLRRLVGSAFREGHDAGYSCACAKVARPDSHGDWLVSRARAALAQPKEDRDDNG